MIHLNLKIWYYDIYIYYLEICFFNSFYLNVDCTAVYIAFLWREHSS